MSDLEGAILSDYLLLKCIRLGFPSSASHFPQWERSPRDTFCISS